MAAQTAVGTALTTLVWARPIRPKVSSLLLLASIWIAVLCPVTGEFFGGFGTPVLPDHTKHLLELSAVTGGIAAILSRRVLLMVVGFVGAAGLTVAPRYAIDSDWALAASSLAFDGLLLGLNLRLSQGPGSKDVAPSPRVFWQDDVAIFFLVTTLAALVATYVLHRHTNGGDEWADTYQAALLAKGHAYETLPTCPEAFRSFWVFQYDGRSFAQHTPGWPLFMAPFMAVGAVWLAGPTALGLLSVATARLSRRAAAGFPKGTSPPSPRVVRAAGWFAAFALALGATTLLNGASRYPHVFVAAMYAWCAEELFVMCDRSLAPRAQWVAGALVGTTAVFSVAASPADGLTLGLGLFAYFVYAAARRRIGGRALLGVVVATSLWGALCLVILRAQLGVWWKTGYSLTEIYYPWSTIEFSLPKPDEVRASIPLDAGSYCWWPASPALGLAGLAALRGRAQRIAFVMALSFVPMVVPMAIGTGVIFAELWGTALGLVHRVESLTAFQRGGPFAVAMSAAVIGVVRIAPLIYPAATADVREHNLLEDALATARLHHTVVIARDGIANVDSMDLTENLPLSLYPDQDVLVARSPNPASDECVKRSYPGWSILYADRRMGSVWFHPDPMKR
jgi:hypothetical protein